MTRKHHLLFFLILLIAALLRIQDIHQPLVDAFSWREASTAMMADNFYARSWNIFYPEVSWTGSDPGYQGRELALVSYLTAMLYHIVGWHDWLGRLVAVCFGLLTVLAVHRLTRRLWGVEHAHAAALMYALLPGAALIDRSFLPDPVMLALVTCGVWLFVKYLQEGRGMLLPVSAVIFTLGVLAKLPGIAVAVPVFHAMVCWVLIKRTDKSHQVLKFISVAALSVVAVFLYYSWAVYLGKTYPPFHVAGSGYIWSDGYRSFAAKYFYLPETWKTATLWYATGPVLLLLGVGLLNFPPRPEQETAPGLNWLFHSWLAGTAIVYLIAAREISVNVWNYHVFSVPIAVFAGRGLLLLARTAERPLPNPWILARAGVIAAVVLVVGTMPGLTMFKYPWAYSGYELGQTLNSLSQPEDYVIAISAQVGDPVAIYYSRRRGWVFPPGGGQYDWSVFVDNARAIADLEKLKASGAKWFGVARDARDSRGRSFFDHHSDLIHYLDSTAVRVFDNEKYLIYRL